MAGRKFPAKDHGTDPVQKKHAPKNTGFGGGVGPMKVSKPVKGSGKP